jgi:hypothetical protein
MTEGFWISTGLGGGLGLLYGLASYLNCRLAFRWSHAFLLVVFGGLLLRLFVALGLLTTALLWLPVARAGLVGGFFGVFLLGLVMEVRWLHLRPKPDAPTALPS